MWKRTKSVDQSSSRSCFSLVHQYIQHFNEVSGNKSASIRRRSKTPGVMITQNTINLPEGKSTPDFQVKPGPITTQEGKSAVFKAVVTGNPKPDVSWRRVKGNLSDKEKFLRKYDESTGEHILEIHKVTTAETDTYKCFAVNEYGKAVCATTLSVVDGPTNPEDFRKLLKKSKVERADGENDERFWDAMLNADRRDYERICSEYEVTDLHLILKKLEEKRKARGQKNKDGVVHCDDDSEEHGNQSAGRTNGVRMKNLQQTDSGRNMWDGEINLCNKRLNEASSEEDPHPTEFKLSNVGFVIKIREITAEEKDDALFECVLTHPLPKITWMRKGIVLEDGEKYSITVSGEKLIHRLLIKDCQKMDKGIYSAIAGITSCSAWLVVKAHNSPFVGKKTIRKTTLARGVQADLEKVAREQQIKHQQEMEKILKAVRAKHTAGKVKEKMLPGSEGGQSGNKRQEKILNKTSENGTETLLDDLGCTTGDLKYKKGIKVQRGLNELADGNEGELCEESMNAEPVKNSRCIKQDRESECGGIEVRGECVDAEQHQVFTMSQHESRIKKNAKKTVRNKGQTKKVHQEGQTLDPNEEDASQPSDSDEKEEASEKTKHQRCAKQSKKSKKSTSGNADPKEEEERQSEPSDSDEKEEATEKTKQQRNSKQSKKLKKPAIDPKEEEEEEEGASQSEPSDSDEKEEATEKTKQQRNSKQSKKSKKPAIGSKEEEANQSEPNDCDEKEEATGKTKQQRNSKQSKKSRKPAIDKEASQSEPSDSDEKEETEKTKQQRNSKQSKKSKKTASGESSFHENYSECEETEDLNNSSTRTRHKRQVPLITDSVIDPGVQFICGLSDVDAIINESAEVTCKLSSEDCEGTWFRDGKKITPDDNFSITKNGPIHKLVILKCEEEHSGKYRFEADGRKTEAMINVKDPPRFDPGDLGAFVEPLTVKVGHHAIFKLQFVGYKPIKIQWFREGDELQEDSNMKIEKSVGHSRLILVRCQRKDTGEIKIKLKNDHGFTEAVSKLIVLDKPTCPLGPAEVTESSATCIEFKWRPPKDDGGSPVTKYVLERQQVGRNTWKKIGEILGVPSYRDADVDRGRKYCYRIRAVTSEGTSDVMETDEMQAGKFAFPGPPSPPKVVSAFNDCVNLSWASPTKTGGSRILGYILEKRKKGSNLWTVVNASDELIKETKYAVKDVVEGIEYEFRVSAINLSGAGEFSNPSEFVFARDPINPPGKVTGLKVTETSYTNMVLTWTKPEEKPGKQDEAKGYFVEIRQADCIEWSRCNITPIIMTSFNVKGLKSMDIYWVRVIAVNDGGGSEPEELPRYVLAVPLPVRPKFTNNKMKSFMVVRAGNSVRITVSFEASPMPEIIWTKDNVPVTKRATVSNSDSSSQLLIPTSERSDSGIYSILVKNFAGQETFSTEVRVTDDPKPPGPVELEESVPGTVTVIWKPSPDEKRDDRLHYSVSKLDSTKHTWTIVADRLFNNKFTVCNIIQGREYHFRVYAKNDMGISAPSESPTWGMEKKKERNVVTEATCKDCDLRCAPTFIVPLKMQNATVGYECYLNCAVKGNPSPRVTWYRNHVSLNTDPNYYITNTCGVCSLLILRVGPKDTGEYSVVAGNSLGQAECSTVLSVRE